MLEVGERYYRQLKGRIAGHVARESDRPAAIVKSTRTIVARGDISPDALARILEEVQIESVQPFVGPPWNQPERFERFRLLKSSISA